MTSRNLSQVQKIAVAVVLSLLVAPVGVLAQGSMRNGCEGCVLARVPTPPVGVLRQAAAREGARLAITFPTTSQQPPPPQQQSWIGRHPILAGTLIGAGGGFVLGAVAIDNSEEMNATTFEDRMYWGLVVLPTGALVGAATGVVVWLIRR